MAGNFVAAEKCMEGTTSAPGPSRFGSGSTAVVAAAIGLASTTEWNAPVPVLLRR